MFPSYDASTNSLRPVRSPLQFSLVLSSTLDVFALRRDGASPTVTGDVGLLHAVDERLAAYGFETNTGVKFVVVVDMRGRRVDASLATAAAKGAGAAGLREGEMKPVRGSGPRPDGDTALTPRHRCSRRCRRPTCASCRTHSSNQTSTLPLPAGEGRRSRAGGLPRT